MGRNGLADRLNANQRRVLDLLLATKPYIVKFRDIAETLNMREASVRTILRRLKTLTFLSFKKARDGNIQGVAVTFNQQVVAQYQQDQSTSQSPSLSASHTPDLAPSQSASLSPDQSASPSLSQPDSRTLSHKASQSPSDLIDRKENIFLSQESGWDDALLDIMWPKVRETGFGFEQIALAAVARAKLGKDLDRERVSLSLDRAEWELEHKGALTELSSGERVRNPASYLFLALARWGGLRAHPEYVSREEAEAQKAAEELLRRQEAAQQVENAQFEAFRAGLSEEGLERIMLHYPGGNREAWLKVYWRKNVRNAKDQT